MSCDHALVLHACSCVCLRLSTNVHDFSACPQDMLDVSMAMRKVARVLWSLHAAFAEVSSEQGRGQLVWLGP